MEKEKIKTSKNFETDEMNKAEMERQKEEMQDTDKDKMKQGNYLKFALMLALSFVSMYIVMFLNAAEFDHVYLSVMRFYMTVLMVAPMAVIMLLLMRGMYKNQKINIGILAASVFIFVLTLYFVRTQAFIGDTQYMKAMIPHHSSAILTSEEADINDPEVKKLAEEIIKTQKEEIALMKQYLEKLGK